jgi:lysophospholipase L1-like esterase
VALLSLVFAASDSEAQFRYLCFGDSITLGNYDEAELGGYPGRLLGGSRLNCAVNGCEVINKGKSGEKTPGGLTRIDNVMDNNPSDVLLLMEGTNDIFVEYKKDYPTWSFETMVFNLKEMARKAEDRGTDAVHASIIHFHPNGDYGTSKDGEVEDLRDEMASAASTNGRYFVDNWAVLCPTMNCFNNHYAPSPPDDRGHPDASGYAIMADQFYDEIVKDPAPGVPSPQSPSGTITDVTPTFTWNRESPVRATWYRFQLESTSGTLLDTWVKAADLCTASTCSYEAGVNLSNGDYSFRLRARNPAGLSAWSSDRSFTVSADVIFLDGFESGNTSAWSSSVQ